MMEQIKKQKRILLEVNRIRRGKFKFNNIARRELIFSAWCERCQAKVTLFPKNNLDFKNIQTGALHVQVAVGGELFVCRNSTIREL